MKLEIERHTFFILFRVVVKQQQTTKFEQLVFIIYLISRFQVKSLPLTSIQALLLLCNNNSNKMKWKYNRESKRERKRENLIINYKLFSFFVDIIIVVVYFNDQACLVIFPEHVRKYHVLFLSFFFVILVVAPFSLFVFQNKIYNNFINLQFAFSFLNLTRNSFSWHITNIEIIRYL